MNDDRKNIIIERSQRPVSPAPLLRVFRPSFRHLTLALITEAFGLASTDELPSYFLNEMVFPAAIGLSRDLDARFCTATKKETRMQRRRALGRYFNSFQYHQAILQCENRMDLDSTVSGKVSPDERAYSWRALYNLKQRKEGP